ncbi:hypothetical protein, partial [Thiolapillus sp.]|uniref:hypothetical protein n=2 Tax=Thiolapillus sp. TaxID=2017437 RepID=UPI0025E74172
MVLAAEVYIHHPESNAFDKTKPGTILQAGYQPLRATQLGQNGGHFLYGQHDGQSLGAFCAYDTTYVLGQWSIQDFPVKKYQG